MDAAVRGAEPVDLFQAPWWLPGGHAQTIWGATVAKAWHDSVPRFIRERWPTPDDDYIDVDHLAGAPDLPPAASPAARPHLVVFHGLEGHSGSPYCLAFADAARRRGWGCSVPHFRGCSGELNRAPRAYHSGDFEEIDWILQRMRQRHGAPVLAVGVSLGGNALMRWAGQFGETAAQTAVAIASVCSPLDLAASGAAIDAGFNREVYARRFLNTMKPKALAKWRQFPGLFDRDRLAAARTLYAFDDVFTAPLHGFRDTEDYWARASARPHLGDIRIPALALNARNDPFIPAASLPRAGDVGRRVSLWQPAQGGHVGFPQGRFPARVTAMPGAVCDWLQAHG